MYTQKKAFTVLEVLIATSLMLILFGGAFGLYRTGSQNFALGDWKIHTQKMAQSFLATIGSELNQANNVCCISPDGYRQTATTPILLNSNAFNSETDKPEAIKSINVLSDAWVPLMFFSITRPYVEKSRFSEEVKGKWKGVSIWGNKGRLLYSRVGSANDFCSDPHQIPANVSNRVVPTLGSSIVSAPDAKQSIILKDVESISFVMKIKGKSTGGIEMPKDRVLQIKVLMRRPELNKKTTVEETVEAAILNNVDIQEF